MKLIYFKYIIEIDKYHSLSRAAKSLYTTQPALSIGIQNFEDELGFKIFERTSKGATLTEKGEKLKEIAIDIMSKIYEVKHLSDNISENNFINIAAAPEICNSLIVDLVETLKYEKKIKLNIHELRTNDMLESFSQGNEDICIGCYTPASKDHVMKICTNNNWNFQTILEDKMVVFISSKDELSLKSELYYKDLQYKTPILFEDHEPVFDGGRNSIQVSSGNYYSFTDKNSIKIAISKGLGYSIMPSIMAIDDIFFKTKILSAVPLADNNIKLVTFMIYENDGSLEKLNVVKQILKLTKKMQERINDLIIPPECDKPNDIQIYY